MKLKMPKLKRPKVKGPSTINIIVARSPEV